MALLDVGTIQASCFACLAVALRHRDAGGCEGEVIQGKGPGNSNQGFRSQAELVQAMADPRYDNDSAYRQDVMRKLENSDIDF